MYLEEQSEEENTGGQVGGLGQSCHLFGPLRYCLCVASGEGHSSFYQHISSLPHLPHRHGVMKARAKSHMKSFIRVMRCSVPDLLSIEKVAALHCSQNYQTELLSQFSTNVCQTGLR